MATETRAMCATPTLRAEGQHLGTVPWTSGSSLPSPSVAQNLPCITQRPSAVGRREGDGVTRGVETMSPEKWSKGLGTLSLGQRRLGDVCELPPTTPRFNLTHRTRVSGGRYGGCYFSLVLGLFVQPQ